MEVPTPKTEGKLHHALYKFSLRFWRGYLHQPQNITMIPYITFYLGSLNANFDFDVSVANDVAKYALPGKVMQWSPCPEVWHLTNENERHMMKLNDNVIYNLSQQPPFSNMWPPFINKTYSKLPSFAHRFDRCDGPMWTLHSVADPGFQKRGDPQFLLLLLFSRKGWYQTLVGFILKV